jgi:hypothetical protein
MKGFAAVLSLVVLVLTGCGMGSVGGATGSSGATSGGSLVVQGTVHGGQQPVASSKVSLWTVGTTGYGLSPTQLTTTNTDNSGNFSLPAPTCASPSELTYVTAVGGSPGGTANPANAQISLIAAIGPCSGAAGTNVNINEVTTVATVYALAKFMAYGLTNNSAPGVQVGYLAPSTVGITNAFATVNNLVNISTGTAYQYTPNGNGLVPKAEINTLANLLATCVNSSGGTSTGTACGNLFAAVPSPSYPANTLQTALNLALQPANNPSGQWSLVTTNGPFQPALPGPNAPNDWALPVLYSGAGPAVEDLAIDASGNIWTANFGQNGNGGGVSELTNLGVPFANSPYLSGNSGIDGIAIDLGGNAWVTNGSTARIVEIPPGGGSIFGPFSFQETSSPRGVAVDSNNNVWIVNSSSNTVTELSNTGPTSSTISPSGGYTGSGLSSPYDVAIDESGDAWVTNYTTGFLEEITPAGSLSSYNPAQAGIQGIAVDQSGNLWVDNTGTTVQSISNSGILGAHTPVQTGLHPNGSYLAIDGADNLWVASQTGSSLSEFNVSGGVSTLSPSTGYTGPAFTIASPSYSGVSLNTPYVARVDQSGNVWVGDFNSIPTGTQTISYLTEFVGLAVPTVEPLALAAQQGIIGLRPGSSPAYSLAVTSSSLPRGVQTAKYSYQLLAVGGTGVGYTWTLTAGQSTLTSVGLTLSSSGLLSGTLNGTVSGASIGFMVTDSGGNTATATLSLTVSALTTLSITTTNISAGTVGTNYNQALAATGGSGSYTWSIPSSTQQTALSNIGINFSNSGYLAGTPTATTTGIAFTVKVTDLATGQTATAPYTFIVNNPVLQQCTHDGTGNSILSGHYAFLLTGFDSSGNVLDQIGSFQANGTGTITNGLGDSNNSGNATAGEQSFTFTGTYSIGSTDKRGQLVINSSNNTNPQYFCFAADTVSGGIATSGRVIDATGDGSIQTGVFQIQIPVTGGFTTGQLTGGYAFGVQGVNGGTPLQRGGVAGQLSLNGSGSVSSGQVDIATYNSSSNTTNYTAAAALSSGGTYTMGTGGRGTLTISAGGGGASFIIYQFGNGNGFFMLSSPNINTNTLLAGYAQQQTQSSFTTANVAAKGVFREDGLYNPGNNGVDTAQIGQIGTDGAGNLTYIGDQNQGGTITSASGPINANYAVTSLGYLTLSNAGNHPPNFYLYAPGGGFGLDSSNPVGLWVMVPQTGAGSFTASSLSGSYGIGTVSPLAYSSTGAGTSSGNPFPDIFDATGTFSSGSLALVQDEDKAPGTIPYVSPAQSNTIPWVFDSTYGASTGRFTIGGQVVGYIVSPTQAILMQNQSGQNPSVFIADHQ